MSKTSITQMSYETVVVLKGFIFLTYITYYILGKSAGR